MGTELRIDRVLKILETKLLGGKLNLKSIGELNLQTTIPIIKNTSKSIVQLIAFVI